MSEGGATATPSIPTPDYVRINNMTILVTGGRGKTGSALTKALHAANLPFLVTSRTGKAEPYKAVTFDWLDPSTYENPFKADANIDRIYVVGPDGLYDQLGSVKPFIDLAKSKGVKRFVLLSASQTEAGDELLGRVHQYLIDIGVDYAVLRPTWFQQNFGTGFVPTIRDNNYIFSTTAQGRVAFVSTEDIAAIALEALTVEPSLNKDILVFGPELLSYDEVAKLLSSTLGREITHKRITNEEIIKKFISFGIEEAYVKVLLAMEARIPGGYEEELFNSSEDKKYIGKHTLGDYLKANQALFIKQ